MTGVPRMAVAMRGILGSALLPGSDSCRKLDGIWPAKKGA